jgi:predicted MFS family arabinose efflux permease
MSTSEVMVSGLLQLLSREFGVSVAQVGYLVSAYAGGMVVGGPLLTVGLMKFPPKNALLVLVAVFFAGQSLGALAGSYEAMVVSRIITGIAESACFGVSVAVAAEIVGPRLRGQAASIVVGGLMVGTVLGLPAATLIGQEFGWRVSFWAVAALVLLFGSIVLWLRLPLPRSEAVSPREEVAAFNNGKLWAAYATSLLIIGATFAAFSYFAPIFTDVSGFDPATVPLLLVIYGAATVVGNIVVGRFADRYTMRVLAIGLVSLIVTLMIFALFARNPAVSIISATVLGLAGVTMNPAMGVRVMRAANARPLVNTVHASVVNLGIVVGPWLGGLTISAGFGLTSTLWVGRGWLAAGCSQVRSKNVAISGAISGRFSSSAKWPVSNRCSSASGTSRR